MRVMEGQAADVRRSERWEAARNRRRSNSRNVCLLAEKQAISRFFSVSWEVKPSDTQRPSQMQWWSFPSTLRSQILHFLFKFKAMFPGQTLKIVLLALST